MRFQSGCMICGEALVYLPRVEAQRCLYCGRVVESDAQCRQGHFVCDECHRADASALIEQFCAQAALTDPLEMAVTLMRHPAVAMHGPEHHFLVPAVLTAAFYNQFPDQAEGDVAVKLQQARKRAEGVRGGSCGMCGNCGAGVGTGIFISLITGATPLSKREWQLSNRMTAESLLTIAEHGGPRCCKRDTFLALHTAQAFVEKTFALPWPQTPVTCTFSAMNKECLREECPFYPRGQG